MFRLLFRQRRRLLFSAFFGTLAMMMLIMAFFDRSSDLGQSVWLMALAFFIVGILFALGILALGAVVLLFLPTWRQLLEMTAFNLFVYATLNATVPGLFELPVVGPFLPFVFWMLLFSLVYGEMLDRFRIGLDHAETRRFFSEKPAQQLWKELVPGEGSIAEHWDALLYELEPDLDDPDSFDVKYTHGASLYELQTMTYLEKTAPFHAKYYHVGQVDPKNRSLVEGTYEITITPRPGTMGCEITLMSYMNAMLPRQALIAWFDDSLGDRTDHLRARDRGMRDWSITGLYRRKVLKYA